MKSIKMKPILLIATVAAFLLSACGAKAVPTIDPAQVQASAVAAANTIVAMTQAAMPTETPVPPTETPTDTPQPTPTIPPLPTSLVLASPTTAPASSSSSGDCQFLKVSKGEKMAYIVVNNRTNVLMGVTFYLKKNTFGDCGYWSSQINPNGTLYITNLPTGCYYVGTWTLSGKPDFQNLGYPFCDTIPDKFTINATVGTISFVPY
ncbi:MAG TPA: hypothetical protein VIN60_00320 [Anaerolineales bacterium]